jgi:histidinol-phosphate aminotransferase
MFDLSRLIRENIKTLTPYSSARDEFSGAAKVFLDANENSLGSPLLKWYNRYPDPHQEGKGSDFHSEGCCSGEHLFGQRKRRMHRPFVS